MTATEKVVLDICHVCATAQGATWPKGHVATFSMGACDACGEVKPICSVSDWTWPKGTKAAKVPV